MSVICKKADLHECRLIHLNHSKNCKSCLKICFCKIIVTFFFLSGPTFLVRLVQKSCEVLETVLVTLLERQLVCFRHRWASTSTSISAISDIRHRHLLFRYQKKICRTETVIPISEGFRYQHLSPFRYPISKKYSSHQQDSNPRYLFSQPLC